MYLWCLAFVHIYVSAIYSHIYCNMSISCRFFTVFLPGESKALSFFFSCFPPVEGTGRALPFIVSAAMAWTPSSCKETCDPFFAGVKKKDRTLPLVFIVASTSTPFCSLVIGGRSFREVTCRSVASGRGTSASLAVGSSLITSGPARAAGCSIVLAVPRLRESHSANYVRGTERPDFSGLGAGFSLGCCE